MAETSSLKNDIEAKIKELLKASEEILDVTEEEKQLLKEKVAEVEETLRRVTTCPVSGKEIIHDSVSLVCLIYGEGSRSEGESYVVPVRHEVAELILEVFNNTAKEHKMDMDDFLVTEVDEDDEEEVDEEVEQIRYQ